MINYIHKGKGRDEMKRLNKKGQALVEYVLIIALVTVIAVSLIKIFGGYLKSSFKKGRLYPNLNEFEARNYLKTNAVKTNERMRYYENMANHIKEMIGENKLKNEDKDEDKKAEINSIINEIKSSEEDEKSFDYFDFLTQEEVERFYEIDEYGRFGYLLKLAQERNVKREALFVLSVFERLSEVSNEDEVDVMKDLFEEEDESEGFEIDELDIDSLLDEV